MELNLVDTLSVAVESFQRRRVFIRHAPQLPQRLRPRFAAERGQMRGLAVRVAAGQGAFNMGFQDGVAGKRVQIAHRIGLIGDFMGGEIGARAETCHWFASGRTSRTGSSTASSRKRTAQKGMSVAAS